MSILLPVYNSMDFVRSEGHELLPKALDSLLNQSYTNFELIILDNQSTDITPDICRSYAAKDSRIRYILDDRKRDLEAAVYHYASFMQGKYCMVANDDDLWHPDYIKKLVDFLEQHPEVDMAYSNGYFVNIDGSIGDRIIQSKTDTYNEKASPLSNYCAYILRRNPIPILFGIFKTATYRRMLPFEHFDKIINANVDNLFMAKFFLMGQKCHYIDDVLFSYRGKLRKPELEMPPLIVWLELVRHQLYFYRKLAEMFCAHDLSKHQQYYLKCVTLDSCLKPTFSLLEWIKNTYVQGNESEICLKTLNKFKKELSPFLLNKSDIGVFPEDKNNNIRFQPPVIAKLIENSIRKITIFTGLIEYYSSLQDVVEPDVVQDIQKFLQNEVSELEKEKMLIDAEHRKTPEIIKKDIKVDEYAEINDETPKLSIISCSKNLGRFLEETILSVARQSFKGYEHIVIDGGSTDETLEILKWYPHIKWISEKDSGYLDAFKKGLAIAKGKYIMQCCVSDGYIDRDWFKRCVAVLDSDIEVSLVWGFPRYLTEDSKLGDISYPQFHHSMPTQKHEWFFHWLKTCFWFPEGNFCVRREVFDKCFPFNNEKYMDPFVEFNYNFNVFGYLPYHIPVVANFGRTHENQCGQKEREYGLERKRLEAYFRKVRHYHWKLLRGKVTHVYRDGTHNILPIQFSNEKLRCDYIAFIVSHIKSLAIRYLPYSLLSNVKRIYRMVA